MATKKTMVKKVLPKAQDGKTVKPTADSTTYYTNKSNNLLKQSNVLLNKPYPLQPSNDNVTTRSKKYKELTTKAFKAQDNSLRQSRKGKPGFDKNGFPIKKTTTKKKR
jgi:hypothetical protein